MGMHLGTAIVRNGKLVIERDVDLPDGTEVEVVALADDDEDGFELSPEETAELEAAIAEADAHPDEGRPLEEVLAELRAARGR